MRPEDALQQSAVRLLRLAGLTFTAPNNGAFLAGDKVQRAIRGAKMKAMGASPGCPDLLIFNSPQAEGDEVDKHMAELRGYQPTGLAIELKAGPKGVVSALQKQWHDDLRQCGWRVEVARSIDDVTAILRECYPSKFPKP